MVMLLSAAVAVAVVVAEAVKPVLDEIAQDLPLALVERLVDLARGIDAGAPDPIEGGVVPAEDLVQAAFVEVVGAERVGHGFPCVTNLAPGLASLSDEVVDRGR